MRVPPNCECIRTIRSGSSRISPIIAASSPPSLGALDGRTFSQKLETESQRRGHDLAQMAHLHLHPGNPPPIRLAAGDPDDRLCYGEFVQAPTPRGANRLRSRSLLHPSPQHAGQQRRTPSEYNRDVYTAQGGSVTPIELYTTPAVPTARPPAKTWTGAEWTSSSTTWRRTSKPYSACSSSPAATGWSP